MTIQRVPADSLLGHVSLVTMPLNYYALGYHAPGYHALQAAFPGTPPWLPVTMPLSYHAP